MQFFDEHLWASRRWYVLHITNIYIYIYTYIEIIFDGILMGLSWAWCNSHFVSSVGKHFVVFVHLPRYYGGEKIQENQFLWNFSPKKIEPLMGWGKQRPNLVGARNGGQRIKNEHRNAAFQPPGLVLGDRAVGQLGKFLWIILISWNSGVHLLWLKNKKT